MTPVHCITRHDPENGTHGDCLRAVIASLLDKQPGDVPHFMHDYPNEAELNLRLRQYLNSFGLTSWWMHMDGATPRDELLEYIAGINPDCHYLLFGTTASGAYHVVICRNAEIVHDPAWITSPLVSPASTGHWTIVVIARQ